MRTAITFYSVFRDTKFENNFQCFRKETLTLQISKRVFRLTVSGVIAFLLDLTLKHFDSSAN